MTEYFILTKLMFLSTLDCLMNHAEKDKFLARYFFPMCLNKVKQSCELNACLYNFSIFSSNNKMQSIFKSAFEGKVATTVILFLSSVLYSPEKDLKMLQFTSKINNLLAHPEIDLQLIIRDSTKVYFSFLR